MMKPYFESMIGKKITHSITTGNRFFTEVYKRMYEIEVLAVVGNKLTVEVKSYDIVPSGLVESGSEKVYNELTVSIAKRTKSQIIAEIVSRVDANFLIKYSIQVI